MASAFTMDNIKGVVGDWKSIQCNAFLAGAGMLASGVYAFVFGTGSVPVGIVPFQLCFRFMVTSGSLSGAFAMLVGVAVMYIELSTCA